MKPRTLNEESLRRENRDYAGTGGRSQENAGLGFSPAYFDFATQQLHLSRFADGRPAPIHVLDGLPDDVVVDRLASGRVVAVKASLVAGFVRNGFFYTRSAAARAVSEWRGTDR